MGCAISCATLLTRKEKNMEEKKVPPTETDAQKIERIEKALAEKDTALKEKDEKIASLEKKINSMKVDSLVQKVDTKVVKEEEPVEFDFDL